jgi:fructosamine-3-kinase
MFLHPAPVYFFKSFKSVVQTNFLCDKISNMLSVSLQNKIKTLLSDTLGSSITSLQFIPITGGSINQTFKLTTNTNHHFFCKINSATKFPQLFQKEKNGLELLAAQKIIRIPQVFGLLEAENLQVLILE